jgi:succinoglycan biosynthesis protein ExoO
MKTPHVSFLMAAYNAGPFIQTAILSAISQSGVEVEVIVVDDGSTDDTVLKVRELMQRASNVRLLQPGSGLGPSGARNAAIDQARGEWLAVLDADDILLPHRTLQLLEHARETGAAVIADNLYRFYDGDPGTVWPLLPDDEPHQLSTINLAEWISRNSMLGGETNLGFLKPMAKADFIRCNRIKYRTDLRIGEDYVFILQCLAKGAHFTVFSEPMYLYRVHAGSLSRRLDCEALQRLLAAQNGIIAGLPLEACNSISGAFFRSQRNIFMLTYYESLKAHISAKNWTAAIGLAISRPSVIVAVTLLAWNAAKRKFRIWRSTSIRHRAGAAGK